MWSAHSYYMVEVMLVRYVNINARCRASGVLVPLACVVRGNSSVFEWWMCVCVLVCAVHLWPTRVCVWVGVCVRRSDLGCLMEVGRHEQ